MLFKKYSIKMFTITALIILAVALGSASLVFSQGKSNSSIKKMENKLFNMINNQRRKNGLKPLTFDGKAYRAARAHSADMAKRDYFNHNSPDGKSVTDRLRKTGLVFRNVTWGENIACNYNYPNPLEQTVKGWMNSPGHRKNILNPRYQYGAIGIAQDKEGKYYYTQVFWGRI